MLNAYAKRLKKMQDAAKGSVDEVPENQVNSYSVEEKRRRIINKISADIIERIARSEARPRPVESATTLNDPSPLQGQPQSDLQTELLRYHILTKNGEKVSAKMKILDSDYLIKQLEEIARKSSEK
ncbi:MAG: hypothetical protein HF978_05230 [Desulfobacteraceae bacterium]|nr:hypothetical protein [Desulfobacteraceae bacterium]MBC2754934.1 hypothetical protein [Desulfobacteraceae bacterium]